MLFLEWSVASDFDNEGCRREDKERGGALDNTGNGTQSESSDICEEFTSYGENGMEYLLTVAVLDASLHFINATARLARTSINVIWPRSSTYLQPKIPSIFYLVIRLTDTELHEILCDSATRIYPLSTQDQHSIPLTLPHLSSNSALSG